MIMRIWRKGCLGGSRIDSLEMAKENFGSIRIRVNIRRHDERTSIYLV